MPLNIFAFAIGIRLFQQLAHLPNGYWFAGVIFLTLLLGWKKQWVGCAFLGGWVWAGIFAFLSLNNAQLPTALEGQEIAVQGVVSSIPQQDERKTRFDFKLTDAPPDVPTKLKLSWYYPIQPIKAGQHWQFKVKLKKPHGLLNPGGFDYERWLFTQGVGATGYVREPKRAQLIGQDSAWQNITILRQHIAERIHAIEGLQYAGFITALTIGHTDGITQPQWQVLKKTGTLHLIAISGSHISLVAGLVYLLVRWGWARTGFLQLSPQRIAAGAAILSALLYALLAGFSVPTQRAVIMFSVAMLGVIGQRQVQVLQMFAIALLVILICDPLAILSVGLMLSFSAVALILFMVAGRLSVTNYWVSTLKVNGIMALGLAPLLLGFFQQIPLISPLANLIAVPVIGFLIVPLALMAVLLLAVLPSVSTLLFSWADVGLAELWWLLDKMAQWPVAVFNGGAPTFVSMGLAIIGILILCMPRGLPGRYISFILCLPLFFNTSERLPPGHVKMTLLDVGQGLATVVQTAEHVLVFDTGIQFSAQSDSGQNVLLPFLTQQGIKKLDGVIISHGDNDHIGGAASLLAHYTPDWLYTSVPQQLQAYAPSPCVQGQHWHWDAVEFTMLGPKSPGFLTENDNSCVLHIKATHGAILMTGDIEQTAEAWLVETYGEALRANVLVAPHHGSNTSSTSAFLQNVAPEVSLLATGYRNPFHFPHPAVIKRYQAQQIRWFNTAELGAIQVDIATTGTKITAYREQVGKYWQAQR